MTRIATATRNLIIGFRNLPATSTEGRWLVIDETSGRELGLVTKIPSTRTETHPYKAHHYTRKIATTHTAEGWMFDTNFLGSFYEEDGGRQAAADAIVAAVNYGRKN